MQGSFKVALVYVSIVLIVIRKFLDCEKALEVISILRVNRYIAQFNVYLAPRVFNSLD